MIPGTYIIPGCSKAVPLKIAEFMKSSTVKSLLLLLAMGLTLVPAHLDVACDEVPHPEVAPCDILLVDTGDGPASGTEPGHGNDNCCETGCQHCSLPCCSGTAMIPTAAHILGAALTSGDRLAIIGANVTWADPGQLYHPPRA